MKNKSEIREEEEAGSGKREERRGLEEGAAREAGSGKREEGRGQSMGKREERGKREEEEREIAYTLVYVVGCWRLLAVGVGAQSAKEARNAQHATRKEGQ